jgi:hypothetical protein
MTGAAARVSIHHYGAAGLEVEAEGGVFVLGDFDRAEAMFFEDDAGPGGEAVVRERLAGEERNGAVSPDDGDALGWAGGRRGGHGSLGAGGDGEGRGIVFGVGQTVSSFRGKINFSLAVSIIEICSKNRQVAARMDPCWRAGGCIR